MTPRGQCRTHLLHARRPCYSLMRTERRADGNTPRHAAALSETTTPARLKVPNVVSRTWQTGINHTTALATRITTVDTPRSETHGAVRARTLAARKRSRRRYGKSRSRCGSARHRTSPYSGDTNAAVWLKDFRLAYRAGGADDDLFIIQCLPVGYIGHGYLHRSYTRLLLSIGLETTMVEAHEA